MTPVPHRPRKRLAPRSRRARHVRAAGAKGMSRRFHARPRQRACSTPVRSLRRVRRSSISANASRSPCSPCWSLRASSCSTSYISNAGRGLNVAATSIDDVAGDMSGYDVVLFDGTVRKKDSSQVDDKAADAQGRDVKPILIPSSSAKIFGRGCRKRFFADAVCC